MNQYELVWTNIKSRCKLSVCTINYLRLMNEQVNWVLRYDTRQVHVFTIFKCDYNVDIKFIIYLFDILWAIIRPWVQLALRANFVQLLQSHLLFSTQISFGLLLSSVATFISIKTFWRGNHMNMNASEWNHTYGIHHWMILRS